MAKKQENPNFKKSYNKMTPEEQNVIFKVIRSCFE